MWRRLRRQHCGVLPMLAFTRRLPHARLLIQTSSLPQLNLAAVMVLTASWELGGRHGDGEAAAEAVRRRCGLQAEAGLHDVAAAFKAVYFY